MKNAKVHYPLKDLPYLTFAPATEPVGIVPDDDACFSLWDEYGVLDNVRAHSLIVAGFATALAHKAVEKGYDVCVASVRAAALLHDVAKSYTIHHGGSHAQMGSSWVVQATGNRRIAQGVAMHVFWPFALPENMCALPFFIIYADKRVMHDKCVTLEERYEDLLARYGTTEQHRLGIAVSYKQGQDIESALSAQLECDLNAYTFDSGRLVQRT